ncbi:MAG: fumarylacetoacetate hydrolase family protein [Paludibacteraceae bacterium]|nr:fumarylacetoacetate hydrolase family protein [Paludibacteraceae bacterium]
MKIIAIGWNYPRHNAELSVSTEKPEYPVIFMKPDTAVLREGEPFYLPDFSNEIHYETEVVVRISKMGKNIARQFANRYYDAIGLGIDFTARDLQRKFKQAGDPWDLCKGFDNSAPISRFIPKQNLPEFSNLNFHLLLNGKQVQTGKTADMFFHIDEIIEYVSRFVTLKVGDVIFTGTPEGVGPVKVGDHLQAFLENEKMLDFKVN